MSPLPVPKTENDLGPCISALAKEGYTNPQQREAICYSMYRKAHGIGEPKGGEGKKNPNS